MLQVLVRLISGRRKQFTLDPTTSFHDLKHRVREEMANSWFPSQQRVVVGGRQVEDHELISDYPAIANSEVHIVARSKGPNLFRMFAPIGRSLYPELQKFLPIEQVCTLVCAYLPSEREWIQYCDTEEMMSYQYKYCSLCNPTTDPANMRLYPKHLCMVYPKCGEHVEFMISGKFLLEAICNTDLYYVKLDDSLVDLSLLTEAEQFEATGDSAGYLTWEQFSPMLESNNQDDNNDVPSDGHNDDRDKKSKSVHLQFLCSAEFGGAVGETFEIDMPKLCPTFGQRNYYLVYAIERSVKEVSEAPDHIFVSISDLETCCFNLICLDLS